MGYGISESARNAKELQFSRGGREIFDSLAAILHGFGTSEVAFRLLKCHSSSLYIVKMLKCLSSRFGKRSVGSGHHGGEHRSGLESKIFHKRENDQDDPLDLIFTILDANGLI